MKLINNNKNKLNSKLILIFYPYPKYRKCIEHSAKKKVGQSSTTSKENSHILGFYYINKVMIIKAVEPVF